MHPYFSTAISLALTPVPLDSDKYGFTLLQLALVIMITGVVFWGVADWSVKRKLQPELEQERKLRLQSELKRQEEFTQAGEKCERLDKLIRQQEQQLADLASQHSALQARADRDASQAAEQITMHQSDAAAALQKMREAEALHSAAETKIGALEAALEAEKGRIGAMQEAMEAKQDLAKQLAQELSSTRNAFADERKLAQERESNLRAELATHERLAASGQSMVDVVNQELEKTRAAQAELEKESASKLAELQRKLSAADQKSAMLQKEVMALVGSGGSASDAAETVTLSEELSKAQERAKSAEKKIIELEAQMSQGDAGTRKRLREAEYKICELEYKLAQVDEKQA